MRANLCLSEMNAPAVLELPLDDSLLKVLSSESRREILRLLRERRMTGAELATRLDLGKPAVSEHLKKLQDAQLIERFDDPERRWVYYNLSSRGRGILEPQRVRFYLVMAVAALGLMVGVALALGVVVLMQGHGPSAAAGFQQGPLDGSGLDVSQAQPGTNPQGTLSAVPTTPTAAPTPSAPTAAAPALAAPAIVPTAPRATIPVGNTTALRSHQPFGPVLDSSSPFIALHPSGSASPATTVLVYRIRDLDHTNHTLRLHVVALDDPLLAAANLTEAAKDAATVPGIGVLLEVPDDVALPETENSTATLSLQDEVTRFSEPVLSTAFASQGGVDAVSLTFSMPTLEQAQAQPAQADRAEAAPAQFQIAAASPSPLPAATPVPATQPAHDQVQTKPAAEPNAAHGQQESADKGAQPVAGTQVAGQVQAEATAPSSARASIPLVSLLAAALMVSIYLPNRRQS